MGCQSGSGNSDTTTTGDINTNFLKKADRAAAEKMDDLMTRRKKQEDGKQISGK
jgi:hypothetical protein